MSRVFSVLVMNGSKNTKRKKASHCIPSQAILVSANMTFVNKTRIEKDNGKCLKPLKHLWVDTYILKLQNILHIKCPSKLII
jgi:hypothetical protein